jgi:hypothetical protein
MTPLLYGLVGLYGLCCLLLLGMATLVLMRRPTSALHRQFALVALALLVWVATLYFFHHTSSPSLALLLGRLNFAAVLPAVTLGYLLVRTLGQKASRYPSLLLAETLLLTLLTAFTPLIDEAERLGAGHNGRPLTVYGPLFPLYLLHLLGYLSAAVLLAFRYARSAARPVADQLYLVGAGILATGLIALVTNAVLPYGFGDFRYTDVGPLSTIAFLLCVGYAILKHRLFDLKLFVRRTLVWGLLLSFVLSAYSAVVVLVTDRLAGENAGTVTRFAVLMLAFSFDPLRRFLEQRIDRLLFPVRRASK